MEFVKEKLIDSELKLKRNSSKFHNRSGSTDATFMTTSKFPFKRHECGKIGHKRVDCWRVTQKYRDQKMIENCGNTYRFDKGDSHFQEINL